MARESPMQALLVAGAVALVCSGLVSGAVYLLRPMQEAYAAVDRNRAIVRAAFDLPASATDAEVVTAFVDLEERKVGDVSAYVARSAGGDIDRVVVPFSGRGMWSTIEGFVALDADLVSIRRLVIHGHGETPGIGDRIEGRDWLDKWRGKRLYDAEGRLAITVVAGADSDYEVDVITGATITSESVGRIVRVSLEPVVAGLANALED